MHNRPRMTLLDPQTFSASILADSEGLIAAQRALGSCLAGPDKPLDLIVQDLCSIPKLFEFVISAFPSGQGLVYRILDAYPIDPELVEASYTTILLQRISSFFFALPPDLFPTHTIHQIGRHKIYVSDALPILTSLCSTENFTGIIADTTPTSALKDPEYDIEEFSPLLVRDTRAVNKKPKKPSRKNRDKHGCNDMSPFHKFGIDVPSDNSEAYQKAREITDHLKLILQFYLELLLEPYLAEKLKDGYISTKNDSTVHLAGVPQQTNATEAVEGKQSAYPNVQPMKAALHFENAEGFGEWRIIIGSDATKKLRELANGDRKKCAIIVKKIKQLSNGHFSDENQKRLNGSSGVPLFEAKMQRDLRLVYQVDVIPDHDGKVERQAIKIYGIYTHTQLNRIWDAMGQHLAGKGKEYKRRCIFRNRPVHAGGDVYLPACFPPETFENDIKSIPLVLSNEEMGDLHTLLVLDKYVTFSQAFLHSLIANQDVHHVFELTPHERKIVGCRTSCYVLGRSGTGKTTTMLFKMLGMQRAWEMQASGSDMPKPRQVFVTKSGFLATKVEEYFTNLLESLTLAGCSLEDLRKMQARSTESGLVDIDEIHQASIPKKYSLLVEGHFPLFVTFDELAQMIAVDLEETIAEDSFVTYDVFARTYWPHFPQPLTKGLEPWLVFSEFMGIIKGSEKSLACPNGFLDEATYCDLPVRSYPTFANHRKTLYVLFEAYCKIKRDRRHHDVADRTHGILRALLGGTPLKGERLDYVYVDEAQDNLLIDALLLRLICRNPEGLFWAGDTAQTISAGSFFRFDDLKAFLFRIEQDQSRHLTQDRSTADPAVFQLAINYRSHGGIVDCAHSVIERITHFWPDAIDSLQAEHGIVDGSKPVFLHGWDEETVPYQQFLFGESGNCIELGAEQCIIVRDKGAAEKLRSEVGYKGVIMTLYDSKGLEFNDVLLYNFFEDSAVDVSRWRVLLNYAEGEVDGKELANIPVPSFGRDDGRFAGICSELKMLYVGITRARKNLWICDRSPKSEPMRMIWTSRNQIQNYAPGSDIPHIAISSTPEEWKSFGQELFKHKRYSQAMHCFMRASLPQAVKICEAFYLRELARAKVGVATQNVQQGAFLAAADAFVASGKDLPTGKDKLQYCRNAADCYVHAGDDRKAAIAFLSAQEYSLAARHYRKAGLFEQTLKVLHEHSEKMPSGDSEELYDVCRLWYCKQHDGDRPCFPLFSSFEEELDFLTTYDLDFARAALLESRGRYLEAAELHLSENRPLDAIKSLLKEKGSRDATRKAVQIVLDGLWLRCSFAVGPREVMANQDVTSLLKLAQEFPVDLLDPLDHDEISMFQAIAVADSASLEKLAYVFIKGNRKAAALLALNHFFSRFPELKSYEAHDMSLFLLKFLEYARLLHSVISHPDPLSVNSIRQLFCIRKISKTEYGLEHDSFLHRSAASELNRSFRLRYSAVTLSKNGAVSALRKYLMEHLCKRVTTENNLCYGAVAFSQCLTFIITGNCDRPNCPQAHVKLADLDSKQYNVRLGIHLQQICILQLMYSVNPSLQMQKRSVSMFRGLWLILISLIPNAREGLGIMKHWVRDALYTHTLRPLPLDFLTTVLKLTSLLFTFDRSSALRCMNRAYSIVHCSEIPDLKYAEGGYAIEDIVGIFDGTQKTCITAGLKILMHVLESSQAVDLSLFCDYLEEVVGKICVSSSLSFVPPLDGLVLPRGWLSSKKDFFRKKEVKITLVVAFLDSVQDLLMRLQSGSASRKQLHVSAEGATSTSQDFYTSSYRILTPLLCNVFISRICRALCFLSYNVRNDDIRHKVRDTFSTLRLAGMEKVHSLYQKYVMICDDKYLNAVVEYDVEARVVIKDLVQLHKQGGPQRAPQLKLVRIEHIQFSSPSKIPVIVPSRLVMAYSALDSDVQSFVPRAGYFSQTEHIKDEQQIQPERPNIEPVDEVHEEPEELIPAVNKPALIRDHEPTEEEVSAAKKIQTTYRTYVKHRNAQVHAIGKGLGAHRNPIFIACLKNIYASGWKRTRYRTLYLWALPRLIVCLDKVVAIAHKLKGKTKLVLLKESHEGLEEVIQRTNKTNALFKEAHELRKTIDPDAPMHQANGRSKAEMKRVVLHVENFIRRLPTPVPEIQEDFHFAYELVMVEKHVLKRERPSLNTEDLDF